MSLRSRTPPRHKVPFQRVDHHMRYLRALLYSELSKVVGNMPLEAASALLRCLQRKNVEEYSEEEYSEEEYSEEEYSEEDEKED